MHKWTDPDIIRQIEALAAEQAAGKTKRQCNFEAAMAEVKRNMANTDPMIHIPARLMVAVVPILEDFDAAARANDTDRIIDMVKGLSMAIALDADRYHQSVAELHPRRHPDQLVEHDMKRLHDERKNHDR